MTLPEPGAIVCVEFLDHVSRSKKLAPCRIYGEVMKVGKRKIVIGNWLQAAWKPGEPFDNHDYDYHTVVISAITKITSLNPRYIL